MVATLIQIKLASRAALILTARPSSVTSACHFMQVIPLVSRRESLVVFQHCISTYSSNNINGRARSKHQEKRLHIGTFSLIFGLRPHAYSCLDARQNLNSVVARWHVPGGTLVYRTIHVVVAKSLLDFADDR